jgi:hypothetical protein
MQFIELFYPKEGVISKAKKIVKGLFLSRHRYTERSLLLLHLFRNETYQYVIKKNLSDMSQETMYEEHG